MAGARRARGEGGLLLAHWPGILRSAQMMVGGPRPPSFPWRREPTPPLDARRHGHDEGASCTGMTIEAALDDRSPIGVGDKLRIKCEAGYTGMTIEARGKRGIGGSLDFPAQPTRCGKM